MLSPTQGMLLSTRTPTHRSRFLYWIEDIFTVLASTYSTLNSVRGPTPADANPSTRGLIWIRAHTA